MITILPVHTTDDDDRRHSMVDFLGIRSQKRNDDDDATYRAALDVDLISLPTSSLHMGG